MSTPRQILAAIFDMDGLLIDSEPLWDRAELDVMASLGVDINRRNELPDTLGLRIDMVVDLWFAQQPWVGPDRDEVTTCCQKVPPSTAVCPARTTPSPRQPSCTSPPPITDRKSVV